MEATRDWGLGFRGRRSNDFQQFYVTVLAPSSYNVPESPIQFTGVPTFKFLCNL